MSKRTTSPGKSTGDEATQEYRKPQANVYTVLLVVSLLMVILASAVLWMVMKGDYNNEIKGGPNVWHRPACQTPYAGVV